MSLRVVMGIEGARSAATGVVDGIEASCGAGWGCRATWKASKGSMRPRETVYLDQRLARLAMVLQRLESGDELHEVPGRHSRRAVQGLVCREPRAWSSRREHMCVVAEVGRQVDIRKAVVRRGRSKQTGRVSSEQRWQREVQLKYSGREGERLLAREVPQRQLPELPK